MRKTQTPHQCTDWKVSLQNMRMFFCTMQDIYTTIVCCLCVHFINIVYEDQNSITQFDIIYMHILIIYIPETNTIYIPYPTVTHYLNQYLRSYYK